MPIVARRRPCRSPDLLKLFKSDLEAAHASQLDATTTTALVRAMCTLGPQSSPAAVQSAAQAREQLILSFGYLGLFLAKKFPRLDPYEAACVTNMAAVEAVDSAVRKFDATRKGTLSSYVSKAMIRALVLAEDRQRSILTMNKERFVERRAIFKATASLSTQQQPVTTKAVASLTGLAARTIRAHESIPLYDRSHDDYTSESGLTLKDTLADPGATSPEQLHGAREGRAAVEDILARHLRPIERRVFELVYLSDGNPPLASVAGMLGMTIPQVKYALLCGAKRLRKVRGFHDLLVTLVKGSHA